MSIPHSLSIIGAYKLDNIIRHELFLNSVVAYRTQATHVRRNERSEHSYSLFHPKRALKRDFQHFSSMANSVRYVWRRAQQKSGMCHRGYSAPPSLLGPLNMHRTTLIGKESTKSPKMVKSNMKYAKLAKIRCRTLGT